MKEITNKERIVLAKAMMNIMSTGDWTELFTLTDCEYYPEEHPHFMNDVHWQNDGLKMSCINAVNEILDRDHENISHIWECNGVANSTRKIDSELYSKINAIIDDAEQKTVSIDAISNTNENIYNALDDAELLIEKKGAAFAYDRVHNALHSCLRQICINNSIKFDKNDSISALLSIIIKYLKGMPDDGRNEKVFNMLRSANAILDNINHLRNHHSLAHPTENLLNEKDAMFAINLAKSIMNYVDSLLE